MLWLVPAWMKVVTNRHTQPKYPTLWEPRSTCTMWISKIVSDWSVDGRQPYPHFFALCEPVTDDDTWSGGELDENWDIRHGCAGVTNRNLPSAPAAVHTCSTALVEFD